MMSYLEKAYQADLQIRRDFSPDISARQQGIAAHDFGEGAVYEQNGVRVTAFKVKHANVDEAFGFPVDYRVRAVVIQVTWRRTRTS